MNDPGPGWRAAAGAALAVCLPLLALAPGGCASYHDLVAAHQETAPAAQDLPPPTPRQDFARQAERCMRGDFAQLASLVASFRDSLEDRTLTYQDYRSAKAFESCARIAAQNGHGESAALIRHINADIPCAEIARDFYARGDAVNGAYWLQRLIDRYDARYAYNVAGREFLHDPRTLGSGVRMLAEAARMGNSEAQQLLSVLAQPGSMAYRRLLEADSQSQHGSEPDEIDVGEQYPPEGADPEPGAAAADDGRSS